jgi:hypothetical protein
MLGDKVAWGGRLCYLDPVEVFAVVGSTIFSYNTVGAVFITPVGVIDDHRCILMTPTGVINTARRLVVVQVRIFYQGQRC